MRAPAPTTDGHIGRYLQPEPKLQEPKFVENMARRFAATFPAYSYGRNNPLSNSDPNGEWPWEWRNSSRVGYYGYDSSLGETGACTCHLRIDKKGGGQDCYSFSATKVSHLSHPEADSCPFAADGQKRSCDVYCRDEALLAWNSTTTSKLPASMLSTRGGWDTETCLPFRAGLLLDVE